MKKIKEDKKRKNNLKYLFLYLNKENEEMT